MNIFESEEGVNAMDLEDNEEFIRWLDSLGEKWLVQEPPEQFETLYKIEVELFAEYEREDFSKGLEEVLENQMNMLND